MSHSTVVAAFVIGACALAARGSDLEFDNPRLFKLSTRCAKIHSSGAVIPISFVSDTVRSVTATIVCASPVSKCGANIFRVGDFNSSAGHKLFGDTLQLSCQKTPTTSKAKPGPGLNQTQCGQWLYGFDALRHHPLKIPIMSVMPHECASDQAGRFVASRLCVTRGHDLHDHCRVRGAAQACSATNRSTPATTDDEIMAINHANDSRMDMDVRVCSTDCESVAYFDISHWATARGRKILVERAPGPGTDLVSSEDSSFLSESEVVSFFPGMKLILEPVIKEVMKPVFQCVAEAFGDLFSETLGDQTREILNADVAPDLSQMLGETISTNLTNLLTDGVSFRLTKSLTQSLTAELGPYLVASVSDALQLSLGDKLHRIIRATVPANLRRVLPHLLAKSSSIAFTRILTRSLTHALVPTLTLALSHDSRQSQSCLACFRESNQEACEQCNYSPSAMYYNNYYATYYSDYYSDYYADYYQEAVEKFVMLESSSSGIHGYAHDIKHKIPE